MFQTHKEKGRERKGGREVERDRGKRERERWKKEIGFNGSDLLPKGENPIT